ncbi:MAG: GDP-mannose 4,6-dehydratase [Acidocella sp.]|nr:GDP-mannose 4,6-dehydratase [Acidocella sp.]
MIKDGLRSSGILITGGGGFVGTYLLAALRAALPDMQMFAPRAAQLDIIDADALRDVFAAHRPRICLHLAGISSLKAARAAPSQAWAVNLQGSLNVADAILATVPHCRMIHISSSECYGASFLSGLPLDETAVLAPMNLYAATKAAADLALGARMADGLRLLRLRPFNHTGPGQSEDFVVPAFAAQIARIEAGHIPPEILVGALTPVRDFLDVRDVCAAYAACVARAEDLPDGMILNIASQAGVSIGSVLETLLAMASTAITIREDPARLRPVEIPVAIGNAWRAGDLLGWEPRIGLATTLRDVLDQARRQAGRGPI